MKQTQNVVNVQSNQHTW